MSNTSGVGESGKRKRNDRYMSRAWYKNGMHEWKDEQYRKNIRVSEKTFKFVCNSIREDVHSFEYSVEEKVTISLWKLANGLTNEQCSTKFGISDKTDILDKVYKAIEKKLKEGFLKWPDGEEQAKIKKEFEEVACIPDVIGSVFTTRILVQGPGKKIPINSQLKSHAIPVQGIVDPQGKFLDILCRNDVFGDKTDAEVLEESKIFDKICSDDYIVGGDMYPLQHKLLVPYPSDSLSRLDDNQLWFNNRIADVIAIAHEAFEELVGRWSILTKKLQIGQKIPLILRVCCILHNICKKFEDKLNEEFTDVLDDYVTTFSFGDISSSAMKARDSICYNLEVLSLY